MIPDTAVGPISAAIIAAAISTISLIISKENKTSEFRQDWINSFRKDISLIVTHCSALHAYASIKHTNSTRNEEVVWKETLPMMTEANSAISRIDLMLNLKETDHLLLSTSLRNLEKAITNSQQLEKVGEILVQITVNSKKILKYEWERVKQGEKTFRIAKAIGGCSFIAALIYLGIIISPTPNTLANEKISESPSRATTDSAPGPNTIYIIQ